MSTDQERAAALVSEWKSQNVRTDTLPEYDLSVLARWFAALLAEVRAEEREAAAQVAEGFQNRHLGEAESMLSEAEEGACITACDRAGVALSIAAAIRSREP